MSTSGGNIADYKVSRKVGYAATLKTAPAYTFAGKHDRFPADPGPGPGAYGPSLDFSRPGIGFGSSTRYKNPGDATPAPHDYTPDGSVVRKSSASFTFGGKQKPEHLKSKTPGPGAYDPAPGKDVGKPGQPAITIAPRYNPPADSDKKPAPNAYSPDYEAKERPGVSLKFRHERPRSHDSNPGPGEYPDIAAAYKSPPGKSFGTSRPGHQFDNRVPGPEYSPEAADSAVRRSSAAWSVGRSPRGGRLDNGVPGPGSYLHGPVIDRPGGHGIKSHERSAPGYTFQGKPHQSLGDPTPAPGDYQPSDAVRKSAPAFSMHGSSQKDSRRKYPGPGHYQCEDNFKSLSVKPAAPVVSMGVKPAPPGMFERKPAPNAYFPDYKAKEPLGASLKFRHEPKNPEATSTPAPHDYADKDFRTIYMCSCKSKGYSFGLKPKPHARELVPGPQYNVGASTLGIAASQQLPKQKLSQTVVL